MAQTKKAKKAAALARHRAAIKAKGGPKWTAARHARVAAGKKGARTRKRNAAAKARGKARVSPNPYYKRTPCPPCKEPSRTQGTHRNKLKVAAKACGGTAKKPVKRAQWILCMKRAKT